eukprot:TRINITY_DN4326_c0_g1_i2.p1 TRINITY_DN4326_c0_g1~~TRINITY_DN4326_c0_g1_i2.p1  ORF type:complete len:162 (+),score=6.34 TRINITY_DN4326_c0_g1_i2:129-614(+)
MKVFILALMLSSFVVVDSIEQAGIDSDDQECASSEIKSGQKRAKSPIEEVAEITSEILVESQKEDSTKNGFLIFRVQLVNKRKIRVKYKRTVSIVKNFQKISKAIFQNMFKAQVTKNNKNNIHLVNKCKNLCNSIQINQPQSFAIKNTISRLHFEQRTSVN